MPQRNCLILPVCYRQTLCTVVSSSKPVPPTATTGHSDKVDLLQSPTANVSRCPFAPLYRQIRRSIHKSWPQLLENRTDRNVNVTVKQRLKNTIQEYGATIVVFHVILSVTSLAACYLVVSSGVDVAALAMNAGFDLEGLSAKINIPASSGTFVLAYALYKVFSPLRLAMTLSVAPLIVRHLRRMGVLGHAQKIK